MRRLPAPPSGRRTEGRGRAGPGGVRAAGLPLQVAEPGQGAGRAAGPGGGAGAGLPRRAVPRRRRRAPAGRPRRHLLGRAGVQRPDRRTRHRCDGVSGLRTRTDGAAPSRSALPVQHRRRARHVRHTRRSRCRRRHALRDACGAGRGLRGGPGERPRPGAGGRRTAAPVPGDHPVPVRGRPDPRPAREPQRAATRRPAAGVRRDPAQQGVGRARHGPLPRRRPAVHPPAALRSGEVRHPAHRRGRRLAHPLARRGRGARRPFHPAPPCGGRGTRCPAGAPARATQPLRGPRPPAIVRSARPAPDGTSPRSRRPPAAADPCAASAAARPQESRCPIPPCWARCPE